MPKKSDNFLRGFCKQLREALDEGTELAYEFAELADEAAELIDATVDGTDGDQVELPDEGGSSHSGGPADQYVDGQVQSRQPVLPGLVRGDDTLPDGYNRPAGVPRGTGSGDATPMTLLERTVKKVPDGTW